MVFSSDFELVGEIASHLPNACLRESSSDRCHISIGDLDIALRRIFPEGTTLEASADLGSLDGPLRESRLEAFLSANLALYRQSRSMVALDLESGHAIFVTRIEVPAFMAISALAHELDEFRACACAIRDELAGPASQPLQSTWPAAFA